MKAVKMVGNMNDPRRDILYTPSSGDRDNKLMLIKQASCTRDQLVIVQFTS